LAVLCIVFNIEGGIDECGGGRIVGVADYTLTLVDLEAWVNTENSGIGLGVSRESIKIKAVYGVCDSLIEGFELVTFERDGAVLVTILDVESVFLDIGYSEGAFRERSYEGRIRGEFVELVDDGVPRDGKRHTQMFASVVKILLSTWDDTPRRLNQQRI